MSAANCAECRRLEQELIRKHRELGSVTEDLLEAIRANNRRAAIKAAEREIDRDRERHQPSTADPEPYRTALHEAGHAAVTVLEGLTLRSVELRTNGWADHSLLSSRLGNVTHAPAEFGSRAWARTILAGIAAEIEGDYDVSTFSDYEFQLVEDVKGRDWALEELRATQRLLRTHWRAVRRIQDVLTRQWEIAPTHVQEIVEDLKPDEMTRAERAARLERWKQARS